MKIAFSRSARRRTTAIGVGVVALAVVGVSALGVGAPGMLPGGVPTAPATQPSGFVDFQSPQGGFGLSYPADWTRLDSGDPRIPLVAVQGGRSFQLRVQELPVEVGVKELPAARPLTDRIVLSDPTVKLLTQPQQTEIAGLPSYFYFYTFDDAASGTTGAHSHFFLFKGRTMIVLVFQALPADQFGAGAATFDQIIESIRVA